MSITDWAYIAGIIDGEGCIDIYSPGLLALGKKRFSPRIVVTQRDSRLTDYLIEATGVGELAPRASGDFVEYRWRVNKRDDIVNLLECVRPFLVMKRQQADILLDRIKGSGRFTQRDQTRLKSLRRKWYVKAP